MLAHGAVVALGRRWWAAAAPALMLAAALGGCGDPAPVPPPVYSGILAASEFVPGPNRFPFGLVSREGAFLEGARVTVRFFEFDGADAAFHTEAPAVWRTVEGVTPHLHPDGEVHLHLDFQGVYVIDEVVFPAPGIWGAEFAVDGEALTEGAAFEVKAEGTAPRIGQRVPATRNRTIHDVESFEEISTRAVEQDDLHDVSVAQALDTGEPFVVFFASPRFCVTAMCGPVTDTLERARAALGGAVQFIHIEPWDLEAARNEGRLVPSAAMAEWGLPTEPWTFVVDAEGRVAARYEGLVTVEEVLSSLRPLL